MRGVALLLALCAAGCGGNANISMSGGGVRTVTPLPAGTSVSGGTVRVSVQGGSSTGALIGLGVLAVSVFGEGGWDGRLPRRSVHRHSAADAGARAGPRAASASRTAPGRSRNRART